MHIPRNPGPVDAEIIAQSQLPLTNTNPLGLIKYLTIRPVARNGYGSIAHEAKPNGLLTRGPLRAKGLIVLVSPN